MHRVNHHRRSSLWATVNMGWRKGTSWIQHATENDVVEDGGGGQFCVLTGHGNGAEEHFVHGL